MDQQCGSSIEEVATERKTKDSGLSSVECEALQGLNGGFVPWPTPPPRIADTSIIGILVG
jgi:hypothetical protein